LDALTYGIAANDGAVLPFAQGPDGIGGKSMVEAGAGSEKGARPVNMSDWCWEGVIEEDAMVSDDVVVVDALLANMG
jgi:hypothetical protein